METIVDKHGVEYDIKQKVLIKASPELREEYIIHQNTEIIHPFAFMDCKKIESIVLPDKLQYIGTGSFLGCSALKQGVTNNRLRVGLWASSNGYIKSKRKIQGKVYTIYFAPQR